MARRTINARQGKEEVKSIWNVLVSSNLVSSVQLVKSSSDKKEIGLFNGTSNAEIVFLDPYLSQQESHALTHVVFYKGHSRASLIYFTLKLWQIKR